MEIEQQCIPSGGGGAQGAGPVPFCPEPPPLAEEAPPQAQGGGSVDALVGLFGHLVGGLFGMSGCSSTEEKPPEQKDPAKEEGERKKKEDAERKAKEDAARKERLDREAEVEAKADPQYKTDPEGARKRAAEFVDARDDLSGMFDIVDGNKVPASQRKQNQLTDAEFRKMAKLYADVKAGRGDLSIDPAGASSPENREKFRAESLRNIGRIMQTRSGRALVGALSDNRDDKGVHHKTTLAYGGSPQTSPDRDPRVTMPMGGVLQIPGASDSASWANVVRPDIALYHELVHAYHNAKGDSSTMRLGDKDVVAPQDKGILAEEYQATGLGAWAPGGKYAKQGFNTMKGKPWGDAPFTENGYRAERHEITASGRYDDVPVPEAIKQRYPDWQDWWLDDKLKARPQYKPPSFAND